MLLRNWDDQLSPLLLLLLLFILFFIFYLTLYAYGGIHQVMILVLDDYQKYTLPLNECALWKKEIKNQICIISFGKCIFWDKVFTWTGTLMYKVSYQKSHMRLNLDACIIGIQWISPNAVISRIWVRLCRSFSGIVTWDLHRVWYQSEWARFCNQIRSMALIGHPFVPFDLIIKI